jgi:hypothetical protein
MVGKAEAHSPSGQVIRYTSEGLARWSHGGELAGFDLRIGCISSKNPDKDVALKMLAIANRARCARRGRGPKQIAVPDQALR